MRKSCKVSVNGEVFSANRGDILLDAALGNGIELPHDCRAGQCGTCKLRILDGLTYGGDADENGMVKACQARIITDLDVLVEPVPDVVTTRGIVTGLRPLAPDVIEVRISLAKPVEYLPGQYYKFQFRGFPTRCYSPTAAMTVEKNDGGIRLHVRRLPGGRVSSALGTQIGVGHPVRLEGPFGTAYLRPGLPNRLVLVGSGTGFAPIWAIAEAALIENPMRKVVIIAASKTFASLYMGPAARRVSKHPGVIIIPVASEVPRGVSDAVRRGRPTDHMPRLRSDDIVYACGAPPMVEAVKVMANEAGASFYADPFVAQPDESHEGILAWVLDLLYHFGAPVPQLLLEKPKTEERPAVQEDATRARSRPSRSAAGEREAPQSPFHALSMLDEESEHGVDEPRARPSRYDERDAAPSPSRGRPDAYADDDNASPPARRPRSGPYRDDDLGAVPVPLQPRPARLVGEHERAPPQSRAARHDAGDDRAPPPPARHDDVEDYDILPPHAVPAPNFSEYDEVPPQAQSVPNGFGPEQAQPPRWTPPAPHVSGTGNAPPQARPAAASVPPRPRGEPVRYVLGPEGVQRQAQIQPAAGYEAVPPHQQEARPVRPAPGPSGPPQQRQQPWPARPAAENRPAPPRPPSRPAGYYAGD